MFEHCNEILIPKLVENEKCETDNADLTREMVLAKYRIKTFCIRTLYNWMETLGFKYSTRRKTYYVDGHERPDNVEYRKLYIQRYFRNERRCFRWISLPIDEAEKLELEDEFFDKEIGYKYQVDGLTLIEYHVDDHPTFQYKCRHLEFGGHLSVRKKEHEKPLILIGQDESIFKQYTLSPKQWNLPDGSSAPNPKDDGHGVMLSSFVSRDFGYGHDLTTTQLEQVNDFRKGKVYLDVEAAMHVHGKKEKDELTTSPFVRWLDYGANFEGYWNYHHMIVQFEDIIDVLRVLYQDKYDFIFYFDHSSGHD